VITIADLPQGLLAHWDTEILRSRQCYIMMDKLYKLRCTPYYAGPLTSSAITPVGTAKYDYHSQRRHFKFSTKLRGKMSFPKAVPTGAPQEGEGPFIQWWVLGDRYYIPGIPPTSNYNVRVQFTDVMFYFKE